MEGNQEITDMADMNADVSDDDDIAELEALLKALKS